MGAYFSHHASFIFECLLIIIIIHFSSLFHRHPHTNTLLVAVCFAQNRECIGLSFPSNVHHVLGSLIQQVLIKHLDIQADTSLSSWSLYFKSLDQDFSLNFPKLAVFIIKYTLKAHGQSNSNE